MKCVRCGHDSNYPDRPNKTCPGCKGKFAFEPREGDRWNDKVFYMAIQRVSADGRVSFGREHVYYELLRKLNGESRKLRRVSYVAAVATSGLAYFLPVPFALAALPCVAWAATGLWHSFKEPGVPFPEHDFLQLWNTYRRVHGDPKGMFVRPEYKQEKVPEAIASDLAGFSFDRAVVCDRARTADMLIANNFHFENNCAVLTIDGYPEYAFDVVRQMLRENPKLTVYALHDCTPAGCRLAHKLATEPAWFKDRAKVVDVGLRPSQGKKYHGFLLPHGGGGRFQDAGTTEAERAWLAQWGLELAVLPPEQVIKRLHKAIVAQEAKPEDASVGGADFGFDFDFDGDSLDAAADASDGGGDSFG